MLVMLLDWLVSRETVVKSTYDTCNCQVSVIGFAHLHLLRWLSDLLALLFLYGTANVLQQNIF